MKKNNKALLIDKRIEDVFTRYLLNDLYDKLNEIISNTTNFDNQDLVMVHLSNKNDLESIKGNLDLYITSLNTNIDINYSIHFAEMINNQMKLIDKPIISIDTNDSEYIARYEFDGDNLLLIGLNRKEDKNQHIKRLK